MELLQKYWWIVLIGVAAALLLGRRSSPGGSVQTIGGSGADFAAIASAERQQDEANRVGLVQTLLGYVQGRENLAATERLQSESTAANIRIAQINASSQAAATTAGYGYQSSANQLQYQQYLAALNQQGSQQSQSNWFNLITGLGGSLLPGILGGIFGNGGGSSSGASGGWNPDYCQQWGGCGGVVGGSGSGYGGYGNTGWSGSTFTLPTFTGGWGGGGIGPYW
jgi:hypothetical protein